jgi:hypothetical protein
MKTDSKTTPQPGQRWRARLQAVDMPNEPAPEVTVTLGDFDPRTDAWMVQPEAQDEHVALPAECLIRRVG